MCSPKVHVNDSIQPSWSDGQGGFFVLSDAPSTLPECHPHPADSPDLPRVYAAGDQSAVWRAGEAFLKVHDIRFPQVTREHVILEFLQSKKPLDFNIPDVLYHGEWNDRYYLIISRVPGQLLSEAWPAMDEALRRHYVYRVAKICRKMAEWKREGVIGGVDGGQVKELYLRKGESLDPEDLRENCAGMGMDTSCLVFYHCDLGPTNILVDPDSGGIGIIDWEIAGYVPKEWVRTKFQLSSGMDFPTGDDEDARRDWRRMVARELKAMGFPEAIDGWLGFQESS
ncbi:kinase-like protein [Canariomyces notabilis]|uniref:Kinase-like protein n=1 Tax=Canariomyces notabilis TaxID=2074819 RepID=A0AAN6YT29_9PEZI|nr:kinase-like protein [Canariomyces arenarius]